MNIKKYLKEKAFLKGKVRAILRDTKTGEIKQITDWNKNLITLVGLTAIINRLGNIAAKANEGMITYGAVGTGNTTPLNTDTTMENEVERKLIATVDVTDQTLTFEVFFVEAEANDTITKFALFGEDASAATDSGTMFEYADFQTSFTKTSNETLTIEIKIIAS